MRKHSPLLEQLDEIVKAARQILSDGGYPNDPDSFTDRDWSRLQQALGASDGPRSVGDRVRRAIAQIQHARNLNDCLEEPEPDLDFVIRSAMSLGALRHDLVAVAQELAVNRLRGSQSANLARQSQRQDDVAEVRRRAEELRQRYRSAGSDPPTKKKIAEHIRAHYYPDRTIRTLISYLKDEPHR